MTRVALATGVVDAAIVRLLPFVRQAVVLTGALVAWAIVRGGFEVHLVYGLARDALVVGTDKGGARLRFEDIERLGWVPPLSGSLVWIPAAVLIDRHGTSWRVPGLLDGGDDLIRELLSGAARSDLDTWAEVHRVIARLSRARSRLRAGYAAVFALLVLGALHWVS